MTYFVTYVIKWAKSRFITNGFETLAEAKVKAEIIKKESGTPYRNNHDRIHVEKEDIKILRSVEKE